MNHAIAGRGLLALWLSALLGAITPGCSGEHDGALPGGASSTGASKAPPVAASASASEPNVASASANAAPSAIASASASASASAPELSLPNPERPWTVVEYKKVAAALSGVTYDRYPRKGDPVFTRMTAKENYAFVSRRELPMAERFPTGFELAAAINQVGKLYLAGLVAAAPLKRENLELQVTSACLTAELVPVTREFVKSLDKADPKYEVRMKGLDQVKLGLNEIAMGSLMSAATTEYAEADRRWYASSAFACLPPIIGFLTPKDRADRLAQIAKAATSELDPVVREELSKLAKSVK